MPEQKWVERVDPSQVTTLLASRCYTPAISETGYPAIVIDVDRDRGEPLGVKARALRCENKSNRWIVVGPEPDWVIAEKAELLKIGRKALELRERRR